LSNNLILSIRFPYVRVKKKFWNETVEESGLGDIFFGLSLKIIEFNNNKIYFSSGLKLPTGNSSFNRRKMPIGTGSYDVPFIINSNFSYNHTNCFIDMGYIIIGKSKTYFANFAGEFKKNGNDLFIDYAITQKLPFISLIAEMNYLYIFSNSVKFNYYGVPAYGYSKYKLSISSGIIFSPKIENIKIEIGYSYDLKGRSIYSGHSPIFRIFYKI